MSSSTSNIIGSSNSNICSTLSDPSAKRNSLVKWLENSQFDVNNEWLGRLTAVPHSSIIDFDCDELKPGIEISVIRNNGEIWRAQVIIPKTSSNTIDLPPSSSKKIRTKAMSSTGKTVIEHDTSSSSLDQSGLLDFNDLSSNELGTTNVPVLTSTLNNNSLIILTTTNNNNNNNSSPANSSSPSANKSKSNKDWQFLQTAINEASLNDYYPEQTSSTVIKLNNLTPLASNNNSTNTTITNPTPTTNTATATTNTTSIQANNIVSVSDVNIETILQMQCDLLEQQKELKSIELDTMEQLKLLQQNISKLTRKFDSFETTCATLFSSSSSSNGTSSDLKSVKNVFNKFNSSFKLVESELLKDFQPQHQSTNNNNNNNSSTVNNNNNNNTAGPSSISSSSSSSPATTTVTLTNHGDLNNHHNHHHQLTESNNNIKTSNTTIVNLFQSSSSSTINRTVTKKQDNDSNNENVYVIQPNTTTTSTNNNNNNNKPTKSQGIQTQMALNKFLRESVKQKLGAEFLIAHAVSDIPVHIMRQIKKEAFEKYLPNDQRPIKAWGLAMASLRCLKRDLVKNKNKQLALAEAAAAAASTTGAATTSTTHNNNNNTVTVVESNSLNEMDCDDLKLDSDNLSNNNNNNNKTTRRSGINLTVSSSLSYIPARSATISNVLNNAPVVRRQLNGGGAAANNNSK